MDLIICFRCEKGAPETTPQNDPWCIKLTNSMEPYNQFLTWLIFLYLESANMIEHVVVNELFTISQYDYDAVQNEDKAAAWLFTQERPMCLA